MLSLKRFVSVVVLVYLLLALLFLLVPAVRNSVADLGSGTNKTEDFFHALAWVGVLVLGLQFIIENLDSALLRRNVSSQDDKINELKARLYDQQQRPTPPAAPVPAPTRYPESNVPPTPLA